MIHYVRTSSTLSAKDIDSAIAPVTKADADAVDVAVAEADAVAAANCI